MVVECEKRKKKFKNQEKKLYFNEMQCKINSNMVCDVLKRKYIKQKK